MAKLISAEAAIAVARGRPEARIIAIDGLPVSGKSTLADRLAGELGANAVFLDDFVRPEAEWRGQIGPGFPFGYIRYEAFVAAVKALRREGRCAYRPYDWASGTLDEVKVVTLDRPVIVEGVSALNPELAPIYDLSFWVESDAATTLGAALARGVGDWEPEWRELFMPSVELYLTSRPWDRAEFRVAGRGAERR
jgi:uridine kinase